MRRILTVLTIVLFCFSSNQALAQWQLSLVSSTTNSSWSIARKGTDVLVGVGYGIHFSSDFGATWTLKSCPAGYVRNIVVKDSIIFVNGDFDGVFKSIDNGSTWTSINSGIANPAQAWSLMQNDSLLILGTSGSFSGDTASIYISSDDGASWTKVFSLGWYDVFYSFAFSGNEVFAGALPSGLYYSNDKGVNWTLQSGGNSKHIALTDTNLLRAGGSGIFLSPDEGISWTNVLSMYTGYSFASSGNLTFAGTSNGFYYSTDNGYTWINDNNGLPPVTGVISICVVDSFIFIGTADAEIYRRNIAEISTGVNELNTSNPVLVIFPNPANNILNIQNNSALAIQFTLYNSLGEKLTDQILTNRESTINLSHYSNGIYFYQVHNATDKMTSGKIIKQ